MLSAPTHSIRRWLAVGSLTALGALLAGCDSMPQDPYAVGSGASGIYDRSGIYTDGVRGAYPPNYSNYPSAVPVYPAYSRNDERWRRDQERRDRDAWRERERAEDQRREWQRRQEMQRRQESQQRQEWQDRDERQQEARRQRERDQARENDWRERQRQQQERDRQAREQQRDPSNWGQRSGPLRGGLGGGTEVELGH